ncbi:phosphoribosyltransferase [uncultured Duncaniella sp.]|uniref:phosphoribosyltransferase n=1 Tax=uncultured Duncaniella sp. TaxID=2768039 RepID=UPI0026238EDC|nr:phosphoribosyltransferase [uncultured Duncaniella sp.]
MKAALTYLFKNKRYKEIQDAYIKATTKYKAALTVWAEHESLTISENFEFKTLVADKIHYLQSIESWIHTYNRIKRQCSAGLIYFYSERGSKTIPNPKLDDYRIVSENSSTIETYQCYSETHRRLMSSCREAMERFRAGSFNNFKLDVVTQIALGEKRILAIAEVLKKAHSCESKYSRAWKVFAKGRKFDDIPLHELESVRENVFETKNLFLYHYNQNPKLISLILGVDILPVDSFAVEAIAQEEDIYALLASNRKVDIETFHADVHLEPGKELKRAILDSISYGVRCNFVDTYSISKFYTLRRDFDAIGVYFDDAVSKIKDNSAAVKAYNKDRGNEAAEFIEDYLRASTKGSALYDYIENYKQEKDKRDSAKRIQRSYPKGFFATFGELDIDTCTLSNVINVIESESRVKLKQKELEEVERKRIEAERKKQEEERKKQEIRDLKNCVSSWPQPTNSYVDCFSLYYYYPTTCCWDASPDEWDVRNLIWDFKANPNRPQSIIEITSRHQKAVNEVVPDIKRVLLKFFGSNVSKLTLVCIPSSKRIVTERRYKDFSSNLCNVTGMANGYPYVHVAEEGDASHLGGIVQAQFSVDCSFFKGRYVILFDDVITSGRSMERFKRLLESAGATVIAGLSIGKTKHERQCFNPINRL